MSQGEVSASCSAVSRTTSYPFEVHHKSDERPISLLELEWYRVFLAVRLQNLLGHQSVREPDSDPQLRSESHSHEQHKGAETSQYPTWSRGDATRKHPRRRKTVPERAKNRGEIQRSPLISQLCSSLVPCCLVKSFPSWSKFGGSLFHAVPPPCVSTFHNYGHIHRNQATNTRPHCNLSLSLLGPVPFHWKCVAPVLLIRSCALQLPPTPQSRVRWLHAAFHSALCWCSRLLSLSLLTSFWLSLSPVISYPSVSRCSPGLQTFCGVWVKERTDGSKLLKPYHPQKSLPIPLKASCDPPALHSKWANNTPLLHPSN